MQHLIPGVTPGLTTGTLGGICGATGGLLHHRHVQSRDRAFQQGVAAGQAAPR
jgi:hypothetical protein